MASSATRKGTFSGANVFLSRSLVAPEVFDALHDALRLNGAQVFLCCDPSRSGSNDYHVISSSDHEKFEDLRAKGCNLLGPQCILSCAKECRILPKQGYTCCLAMDGVKVLASGFEKEEKAKIEQLVTAMGGALHSKASVDINFVIVKNVLAAKYKWALNVLKKPIVNVGWLTQCWTEHRIVPQEACRILPFTGLTICVTRIPADERKEMEKLIVQNGGHYSADLTKKCTHLVSDISFNICEKKEVRRLAAWGVINMVKSTWLEECDRAKKELPVSPRHIASELLFPKDSTCIRVEPSADASGIKKVKSFAGVPHVPVVHVSEDKNFEADLLLERKRGKDMAENGLGGSSSAELATKSGQSNHFHAANSVNKDRSKSSSGTMDVQNIKSSNVFRGRTFCFSTLFPQDRRAQIIEWIKQGGGVIVDNQHKMKVHFIIERHGVLQIPPDVSESTVVSTHWEGCLQDVGGHIIYSPLRCHIPLPGFESLRFCISQYEAKDRLLLRNLCFTLGAKFTEKLTKKVTHLLCKFTSGPKYEAARNWGIQSVTVDWITECIKQDMMVALDPFLPKPATIQDREAGLCTVSQYPTQAACMVSGVVPSQLLSDSQGAVDNSKQNSGIMNDSLCEEPEHLSTFGKRSRLSECMSNIDASKKHKVPENLMGGSNAVPDVADAIEDLLAQSTKIQDMRSPGSQLQIYSHDHTILGQDNENSHSTFGISRHWLSRPQKQDSVPDTTVHDGNAGAYDAFSETQTESQTFQTKDMSQLLWVGPVPGDIAEVEAYCRIFRAAEQLHTAIMDTLCNPVTGECTVTYDTPSEDMSLLEEKVVAILGCMLALLNKGREDVLSGRSSFMNSFQTADVNVLDGKLPPLAIFRGEMKRRCESLQVALANYLTPLDNRSTIIWRRLQRLKNVCYDAGFLREDGYPCPTIFANWSPVYFSSTKQYAMLEDSEVAFWRGGQVTDEGLAWLLDRGYKTIVDLREDAVKDEYYQSAIDQAVSCGKIEVINLPVEVGTAPSMQQVERFASLVSDPNRRPIYLHSQEGVNRTSAMVSRWRQYITRPSMQLVPNQSLDLNGKSLKYGRGGEYQSMQSFVPLNLNGSFLAEDKIDSQSDSGTTCSFSGTNREKGILAVQNKNENGEEASRLASAQNTVAHHEKTEDAEAKNVLNFSVDCDPFMAQFPICNFLSKKEMSQFFKSREISPKTYLNSQKKRFEVFAISGEMHKSSVLSNGVLADSLSTGRMKFRNSNGRPTDVDNVTGDIIGKSVSSDNSSSYSLNGSGYCGGKSYGIAVDPKISSTNVGNNVGKQVLSTAVRENVSKNHKSSIDSDGDLDLVEGNMCASTTGVVRVQSRRKAEMYLVRTDGFSCTREKVTESSLAFTHPSTQQQMLMWKSPPKTVLLLKKLGQELMEEAKEVASFLYYQEKMNVLVEPDVHDVFARIPGFGFVQTFYSQDTRVCLSRMLWFFSISYLSVMSQFEDYREDLMAVIHGNNSLDGVYITLRMRLRCEIIRNGKAMPGKVFDILNEVVVDRGSNPYLSKIECYEHDRLITKIPDDTRSSAWVSFDGKRRQQLSRGDSVRISMSQHPLPTVNKSDQTGDWFHSLVRCLNWNERLDQKAL
ncbi:putative NAD kinase 2, chloroplastic [Cocos nucifera]|uniref:Putative NAD kinase 2, chloroplastic n=1 Tax=Cocos nucifera TaxID=13894 RepID=A0A8K0IWT8_COCNU|nr:putative NAD kinase 2, chloroplastic [Cocos nucifera]